MILEIAEDLPDIEADELKVKEIIYNLLSNAVKFTPEGGKHRHARGDGRAADRDRGLGYRGRHRSGEHAQDLRGLLPGRHSVLPVDRRDGTRPAAVQEDGRAARGKAIRRIRGAQYGNPGPLYAAHPIKGEYRIMKRALIIDDNANNLTLEKDLLEVDGFLGLRGRERDARDRARPEREAGYHHHGHEAARYARLRGREDTRTFAKDISQFIK
jgi:hypothetical protein